MNAYCVEASSRRAARKASGSVGLSMRMMMGIRAIANNSPTVFMPAAVDFEHLRLHYSPSAIRS